jgi:hypothetical protein
MQPYSKSLTTEMENKGNKARQRLGFTGYPLHSKSMLDVVDLRLTRPPDGLRPINLLKRANNTAPSSSTSLSNDYDNYDNYDDLKGSEKEANNRPGFSKRANTTGTTRNNEFDSFTIKSNQYRNNTANPNPNPNPKASTSATPFRKSMSNMKPNPNPNPATKIYATQISGNNNNKSDSGDSNENYNNNNNKTDDDDDSDEDTPERAKVRVRVRVTS